MDQKPRKSAHLHPSHRSWTVVKDCLGDLLELDELDRNDYLKDLAHLLPGVAQRVRQLMDSLDEAGSFLGDDSAKGGSERGAPDVGDPQKEGS